MTFKQLDDVGWRTGFLYDLPKKPTKKWTKVHFLLNTLIFNLKNSKRGAPPHASNQDEAHERRMTAMYAKEAERVERQIWNAQAKAGCKMADYEVVARDAEREGKAEIAAKLRSEARVRTPYKGRMPTIRGPRLR